MNSSWNYKSLLSTGIRDSYSTSTNQKITLSNGIAGYFILMSLFYIGISIAVMPIILPYALASMVLYILVPILNKSGYNLISRYIAATIPSIVCFFIHISIIKVSEPIIAGLYLIQVSMLVLPWILFDGKEKVHLFITFALCALLIVLVRPLNGLIEPSNSINSELVSQPWMEIIFTLTSFSILVVSLYILQRTNSNTEKENDKLILLAGLKKEEFKANEDKLNKYIEEIELTQVEDKKREWANNGLAKFADILRTQQDDIQKSYDTIISFLVKYLEANQAGLFIVEEKNDTTKHIQLKSCYAYERKKYLAREIEIGEGLIGQCYLEKDIIYLTDVPQNYVTITSGIGASTPRAVLIVPLILNDEVFGIIELASFKPFEKYQIDFLIKAGENTAATISNLKTNERTKLLLEESQQQSEEMRAQEEEMRQNMEEMQATQEELSRKSEEIQNFLDASKAQEDKIRQNLDETKALQERTTRSLAEKIVELKVKDDVLDITTVLSEADVNGDILFANQKLSELSKYTIAEIIGKPHRTFRHPDMPKELFKLFWIALKKGETFKAIIKNKAKDGSHFWVDGCFVPIKDAKGTILKYVGASYHIESDAIALQMYNAQAKRLGLPEMK